MRRAFRGVFAAVLSAPLLLICAGWWQSHAAPGEAVIGWRDEAPEPMPRVPMRRWYSFDSRRPVNGSVWVATAGRGRLEVSRLRFTGVGAGMLDHYEPFGGGRGFYLVETGGDPPPPADGPAFLSETVSSPPAAAGAGAWSTQGHLVRAPFWALALVSAVAPAALTRRRFARWRRARRGLCVACGYDLRASPDRCPECGRVSSQPSS